MKTPQSPAPVAGRPLTAEDVEIIRDYWSAYADADWHLIPEAIRDDFDARLVAVGLAEWRAVTADDLDDAFAHDRGLEVGGSCLDLTALGYLAFKADADGWMPWNGGENPVPGQMVEVKLRWRNGEPSEGEVLSDRMAWAHRRESYGEGGDIIAFRLSRPASDVAGGVEREAVEVVEDAIYRHVGVDHRGDLYGTKDAAEDILAALSPASPARTPMGEGPVEWRWREKENGDWLRMEGPEKPYFSPNRTLPVLDLTPLYAAPTPMGGEVEALRGATKREEVARIVELAIVRHGIEETALEGTLLDADAILKALATSSPSPAQGGDTELKPDFLRSLPGGSLDDSTFQAIEDALDRAEAPCRADGDKGRWLTLPERIAALSASPQPEAGEARIDYLRKSRDGHAATAHAEFGKRVMATDALISAREALHQHYVDWDGEPEDAVPLQEARAECDRVLDILLAAPPSVQPVEGK